MTIIAATNSLLGMTAFTKATMSTTEADLGYGLNSTMTMASFGFILKNFPSPLLEGWIHFRSEFTGQPNSKGNVFTLIDSNSKDYFIARYTEANANANFLTRRIINFENMTYVEYGVSSVLRGTFHTFDINFKIHDTEGFFRIYMDDILVSEFIGNTKLNPISTGLIAIRFQNEITPSPTRINNFILADEDTRGMSLYSMQPNSAGTNNQMTGAFADVNKLTPNDGTGLTSATADQVSTFNLTTPVAATGNATVRSVIVNLRALKGETGPSKISAALKSSGANYFGPDMDLKIAPDYYISEFLLNPATGLPWTTADMTALEAGARSRT